MYRKTSPQACREWEQYFAKWKNTLSEYAEIVSDGCCYTASEIESVLRCGLGAGAEAVVISALSYAASDVSVPSLSACGLPVLIWNTQEMREITPAYHSNDLMLNHTVQGLHDVANLLMRGRIPYITGSGCAQDGLPPRLIAALSVIRARRPVKALTLGGVFDGMGDFRYDNSNIASWHAAVETLPVGEYLSACDRVGRDEVEAQCMRDMTEFSVSADCDLELLHSTLRPYLALKQLLISRQADGFTMNFTSPEFGGRHLPLYAASRLMADGAGYAGEGDVLRALWMARLVRLTGSANFTEIYTVDFAHSRMLMTHMQECNPAWSAGKRKIRLCRMPFWAGGFSDYAGMYFNLEPGPVTLTGITPDADGRMRLIVFTGEIGNEEPLVNYNRGHWLFHPQTNVNELLDRYSEAGGPHHLIAVRGDRRNELAILAKFDGAEYLDITK